MTGQVKQIHKSYKSRKALGIGRTSSNYIHTFFLVIQKVSTQQETTKPSSSIATVLKIPTHLGQPPSSPRK